ncbi:MAG: hypothetical protein K6T51_12015 [Rubrobacteraceae bacterium]|nr:hypothetical protein [Rubrobacteraceae bacterium]
MGINQRVSLRKFKDDIRRWVEEGRSDEWIASALGTSASSVQSFRSRNAIYRREIVSTVYAPREYSQYEGVLEREAGPPERVGVWFDPAVADDKRWKDVWEEAGEVEVRVTPSRIVLVKKASNRTRT